ncbi:MAG: hypothetical protein ACK40G_02195 [Cytophagaceae bacterium]
MIFNINSKVIFLIFSVFLFLTHFPSIGQSSDTLIKSKKKQFPREAMQIGISCSGGLSNAYGGFLQPGTTKFRAAWGIGAHVYLPMGRRIYFYYFLGYTKRGFNYRFSHMSETATNYRMTKVAGFTKLNFIDKNLTIGYKFRKSISVFTGVNIGVRIKSVTYYEYENLAINKSSGQQSIQTGTYSTPGGSAAQDVIDYAAIIGIRGRIHERLAVSIKYMYDVFGINLSPDATTENPNVFTASSYYSNAILFTIEGHIFSVSRNSKTGKRNNR